MSNVIVFVLLLKSTATMRHCRMIHMLKKCLMFHCKQYSETVSASLSPATFFTLLSCQSDTSPR